MSRPSYPAYKDSGVTWLGRIPQHWGIGQSRRLFALRNERARELDRQLTASQKYGVIYQDDFMALEGQRVVQVIKGADILKHVEPNDFVISMRSFQGGIEWSRLGGSISSAYVMLIPCERIHGPFYRYLLKSSSYIQALQATSNLVRDGQALRYGNFTQVDLPLIPLTEQIEIASFLDCETAKIDALVAEQERLIELLKEKRQAVIFQAVTKGLNPDAALKPSGSKGIGDVPSHWVVTLIKHFSKLQRGHDLTDSERTDGIYPVVTSGGVSGTHGAFMAHGPGVVTGRYGSTGRLFYIETDFWPHNTSLYVVDFHGNEPRFAWYTLQTVDFAAHSAKAAVPGIDRNDIHVLPVAVPPTVEQLQITSYLDQAMAELDLLSTESQRAITLLQERRSAVIAAAVTGKIDVRGCCELEAA